MVNYFRSQFKSVLNSAGFYIAFTLNMALCFYNTIYVVWQTRDDDASLLPSASEMFILRSYTPVNAIFRLLYIFIIVFPMGFYVYKNRKANIQPILAVRNTLKGHYVSSACCAFLCGFLCFFIPLIMDIIMNAFVFPADGTLLSGFSQYTWNHTASITGDTVVFNTIQKGQWFPSLYVNSPTCYNLLYAFIFSLFCGIMSLFIHSLSYYFTVLPVIMFSPLYLLSFIQERIDRVMANVDINEVYINVKIIDYLTIDSYFGKSGLYFVGYCMFFLIVSIVLLSVSYRFSSFSRPSRRMVSA